MRILQLLRTGSLVLFAVVALVATPITAGAADKAKFILVHGAWHVGEAWNGVLDHLREMGHDGEAVTLAGHGKDASRKGVTFADSEKILLDALAAQDQPVILVGHSAAGILLQQAAGKAADKLAAVVFHNAFIIGDGTSLFEALPPDIAKAFEAAAKASADNSLPVNEGFWRHVLLAGVAEDKATEIIAQMVPQPFGYYTHKIDASSFASVEAPKFVLLATGDNSLPQEAWKGMALGLGESETVEIDGGHEVLLTDPANVAAGLAEIANRIASR